MMKRKNLAISWRTLWQPLSFVLLVMLSITTNRRWVLMSHYFELDNHIHNSVLCQNESGFWSSCFKSPSLKCQSLNGVFSNWTVLGGILQTLTSAVIFIWEKWFGYQIWARNDCSFHMSKKLLFLDVLYFDISFFLLSSILIYLRNPSLMLKYEHFVNNRDTISNNCNL